MILIPDRLAQLPIVNIFYQSGEAWIVEKESTQPLLDRQSYISKHAFTMIYAGEQVIYNQEGFKIHLKAGQMAWIKKGLYTVNDILPKQGNFKAGLIFFDRALLTRLLVPARNKHEVSPVIPKDFFKLDTPQYLEAFWKSLRALQSNFPNAPKSLYETKLTEFFQVLQTAFPDLNTHLHAMGKSVPKGLKPFMEQHFDKALTIEDYAYLSGRSTSTFRREFKIKFGASPRQWIIQKRMEKAKSILDQHTIEVSQLALEVGYENTSHFISAYKKCFGETPGQTIRGDRIPFSNAQ